MSSYIIYKYYVKKQMTLQVSQLAVAAADKLLSDSTGVGKAQALRRVAPFLAEPKSMEIRYESFIILVGKRISCLPSPSQTGILIYRWI